MKLIIRAGGAMRSGPERELVDDYLTRASGLSRNLGFLGVEEQSVDLAKCKSRAAETEKITSGLPDNCVLFVMDERGKATTSRRFAKTIADLRDEGHTAAIFAIGGADGFDPKALPKNHRKISFGVQTWPHKIVRVMLTEQIYRGLSILAGTPYHRD